jgi:hypothetical protein
MTFALREHRHRLPDHQLDFVGQAQVAIHGGTFAALFDQVVDDALGLERAVDARTRAAHKASYQMLRGLVSVQRNSTPAERLAIGVEAFAALGYGKLELMVGRNGGAVRGEHLHHGRAWIDAFRGTREHPADAFATGFVSAATEVAYDLTPGSIGAEETECIAVGAEACEFDVRPATGLFGTRGVVPMAAEDHLPRTLLGDHEERIEHATRGLCELFGSLWGDEHGVIDAFGQRVVHHLADYHNHLLHELVEAVERDKPDAAPALRELLTQAGCAGTFRLFGGVMTSPEWEALVGRATAEPLDVVIGGLALARACGYGRWVLEEYEPDEMLSIVSPGTHESTYARLIGDSRLEAPCSVLTGGACAIMLLAHGVTWRPGTSVSADLFATLARDSPWEATVTHSIARGDHLDRVEVRRA